MNLCQSVAGVSKTTLSKVAADGGRCVLVAFFHYCGRALLKHFFDSFFCPWLAVKFVLR